MAMRATAGGSLGPSGQVKLHVVRGGEPLPIVRKAPLSWKLRNAPHYWRGAWKTYAAQAMSRLIGTPYLIGDLYVRVRHGDGTITDYGRVGRRVVTTTGVNFIVDAFQNSVEVENLKYHGFGTGSNAEASANTALHTELTTQYVSDNTRPTGTTTEGASANIYRTVATLDPDADVAITEHGVFDQASNAGGTLLDKTLFSAVNLVGAAGDTLEATYELTFTAGS